MRRRRRVGVEDQVEETRAMMTTEPREPMFYRLIVAAELIQRRKATGKSQEQVERACKLGPSLLSNYETLKSSPSVATAKALFEYFGVSDPELSTLLEYAKKARSRPKGAAVDPAIPEWFELYRRLERQASELDVFALTLIPGLFQTRSYTRAVLGAGVHGAAANREQLIDVRMERQSVLEKDDLHVWAVIKETALLPMVGGRQVMREQLDHLVELAAQPNITLQVLPNDVGAHMSMGTEFAVTRFRFAPGLAVVYTERFDGADYIRAPRSVEAYETAYGHLKAAALGVEPSVQLIQQIRDERYS